MKVTYIKLDGTTFEGPLFSPHMELVSLEDGTVYTSEIVRKQLYKDENGTLIYPEG